MLNVRLAQAEDVEALSTELRDADLRETAAASGETPRKTLENGLQLSAPCYTVVNKEGKPLAMFGVVPENELSGVVWLLASEKLLDYPSSFLRQSHKWMSKLHEDYDRLWNYVDARNDVHIRWLQWCGFSCAEKLEAFGPQERVFYRYERIRGV